MSEPPSPWRPEFLNALRLLASVSEAMHGRGLPRPILVGGGAVEFYSGGEIMTGDIDVTSPAQPELEEELTRRGFLRPSGTGHTMHGWIHLDTGLGFEVVAETPFGGAADSTRLRLIAAGSEGECFRVVSVEDLIADRMGQYASGSAPEMLAQAVALASLYSDLDKEYLDRRIREETLGDYGAAELDR